MKGYLKVLSLFSGCGGLDLGFKQAENSRYAFDIIFANDNFKAACETYKTNFSEVINCKNVNSLDLSKIPEFDVLIGGFPCQDFSLLKKKRGLKSGRSLLYRKLVEMLKLKQPLFFVAENVKGLLSAGKGRTYKIIKQAFENANYNIYEQVIKFVDYGVPQTRERLIIVGVRKDLKLDFKFPQPTHSGRPVSVKEALQGVEKVRYNNEKIKISSRTEKMLAAIPPKGNYLDLKGKTDEEGNSLAVKGLMSNTYRKLHPNEPSPTIVANGGGGTWGYHYKEPRPLTNRERARIQTFPDDFIFKGTITEVRRQIGNAVPPLGAKIIAESLLEQYENYFSSNVKLLNSPIKI